MTKWTQLVMLISYILMYIGMYFVVWSPTFSSDQNKLRGKLNLRCTGHTNFSYCQAELPELFTISFYIHMHICEYVCFSM